MEKNSKSILSIKYAFGDNAHWLFWAWKEGGKRFLLKISTTLQLYNQSIF